MPAYGWCVKRQRIEDLVQYGLFTKAEAFILIATFWNSLSKSCITDPSDLSLFLQTKPIRHKSDIKEKNLQQPMLWIIRTESPRVSLNPRGSALWTYLQTFTWVPGVSPSLTEFPWDSWEISFKSAHTFKRSAWLILSFCVFFYNDQ